MGASTPKPTQWEAERTVAGVAESTARTRAIEKQKLAKNSKLGLREFSKTKNSQQVKNTGLSLKDIQSLRSLNTKVSSFGSPHDDIFKRMRRVTRIGIS